MTNSSHAHQTDDFYSDNNLLSAPIVPKFVRSEALLVKKAGDGGAAGSATTSSANPSPVSKTVTSAPGPPTRVLRIVSAGGRATKDADDDLDELLALGDDKPTASPASFSRIPPTSNAAISKPSATAQKVKSRGTDANDFDQFMDEIDGKGGAKTSSAKPASSAAPPRKLKPLARPTPREGHVGLGATAAAPPKGGKGGDGMEDWLDDVLGNAEEAGIVGSPSHFVLINRSGYLCGDENFFSSEEELRNTIPKLEDIRDKRAPVIRTLPTPTTPPTAKLHRKSGKLPPNC
ncbi:hypothetical protein BC938DRAFT_472895 [Jimgerdemannia flammicorona]|uniref:Uncharacterized protein n=1 Tax=Jimgerdemannia flammicorona TaxID=994334 RepID=A0A433QTN0_9FUNG|nr:hypothetical protein BC938DRAFT_472895 [Jimgerdemannia flammicorona]